jgi:hypothetical protein
MTRQVTDELYIDLGYFTPEDYFVYVAQADSDIESEALLQAVASAVRSADTAADAESVVSVSASVIRQATVSIQGAGSVTVTARARRQAETDLVTAVNLTADSVRTRRVNSQLVASASLTANNVRLRAYESELSVDAFMGNIGVIEFDVIRSSSVSLSTLSRVQVLGSAISGFNSDFSIGETALPFGRAKRLIADVSYFEAGYFI